MSSFIQYLLEKYHRLARLCGKNYLKKLGKVLDASPWLESVTTRSCLDLANTLYCGIELHNMQKDDETLPRNSKLALSISSSLENGLAVSMKSLKHQLLEICKTLEDKVENLVARIREHILEAEKDLFDYAYYKPYEFIGRTVIAAVKWLHDRSDPTTVCFRDLDELENILYDINVSTVAKERPEKQMTLLKKHQRKVTVTERDVWLTLMICRLLEKEIFSFAVKQIADIYFIILTVTFCHWLNTYFFSVSF